MENNFFATKSARLLGMLTLFMFLLALASYASLNFKKMDFVNSAPATISVTGEGEVLGVPDIGQFSFSVNAKGATAPVAQEESGTKINAIVAYLRDQGIEDKDIKTQNYNLYPNWKYEADKVCERGGFCPPPERVQDGFEVSQTISVKVRATDEAPKIIGGVGELGATNISGLNFTIDDVDALQAEARAKAINDAEEKAALLADQLGVRVVRLVSYGEGGDYQPYMMETRAMAMDTDEGAGFGGAELPVGEQKTTAQVTIIYEVE